MSLLSHPIGRIVVTFAGALMLIASMARFDVHAASLAWWIGGAAIVTGLGVGVLYVTRDTHRERRTAVAGALGAAIFLTLLLSVDLVESAPALVIRDAVDLIWAIAAGGVIVGWKIYRQDLPLV